MARAYVRYRPVSRNPRWTFVSGQSFAVALEASVAKPVLDALWWLAETEFAPLESIVGAIPLAGADEVRSFAVVSYGEFAAGAPDTTVTAVVRGAACVDIFSVGGARRFRADGVQPWVLADFRSVTGFVLSSDDHPTSPVASARTDSLPLGTGAVAGETLVWSLSPIELSAAESPAEGLEAIEDSRGLADGVDETRIVVRTPIAPLPAENDSMRHPGEERAPATATMTVPDFTRPAPAPIPVPLSELFGFRIRGEAPIMLEVPAIIGRNPQPPRVVTGPQPRLVRVSSPQLEVSSTHVQLQQVGTSVVATDLRSTNGTFIVSAGRRRERLRPGESRVLLPGATLELGDGNIIEITPPQEAL